jgi:hypothetical protein
MQHEVHRELGKYKYRMTFYIYIYPTHLLSPQIHIPLCSAYLILDVFLKYEPLSHTVTTQQVASLDLSLFVD